VTPDRNKLSIRTFFLPQLISLSFLGTKRRKPCGFALLIIVEALNWFLGSFAIFRKETIGFIMSVRLCACPTGRIFTKMEFEYSSKICGENSSFIEI
jgi:hypothetical protein